MVAKVNSWRTVVGAGFGAVVLVLFASQTLPASNFLQEAMPSFTVKGVTPQEASARRAFDYLAPEKFPDYRPGLRLSLELSPRRREFKVGEPLKLTYTGGSSGYATLIDYAPDGRAQLLARNRPVSPGFSYIFSGEATLPAGEDFVRLALGRIPLSYASLKTLMEYPFAHSRKVRFVVAERWVRFEVAETALLRDPFYRYPHVWGRRPLTAGEYCFVQLYDGMVLSRGISLVSAVRIFEEFGAEGPLDFWLLAPGDSAEMRFQVGTSALPMPRVYLLLFMAQDVPPELSSFGSNDIELTIEVNGVVSRKEYRPRFTYLDDENTPEVFELRDHLRYGPNWIVLRVDAFSDAGIKLRRVELRSEIDELDWMNNDLLEEK